MNKKYCLLILLLIISSCKEKENEESINIGNNDININSPENIYHSIYTNVVKIQGKFVDIDSSYFYGGRKEGKYSEDYDIFEAIENGSIRRVMELINEGADINMPYKEDKDLYVGNDIFNVYKATPLIFAVFYRDLGIIKYLLDNNANPYIADNDGWNSFMWACNNGNIDTIKMLIQRYPDLITSESKSGANVLHLAVLGKNIKAIEYLVKDLGIMDIESVDNDGDGVFYYAGGNNEVIEKLKELGAKDKD